MTKCYQQTYKKQVVPSKHFKLKTALFGDETRESRQALQPMGKWFSGQTIRRVKGKISELQNTCF